jgi:hypothetical protein
MGNAGNSFKVLSGVVKFLETRVGDIGEGEVVSILGAEFAVGFMGLLTSVSLSGVSGVCGRKVDFRVG